MKKCVKCLDAKNKSDFYIIKNVISSVCKICHKESVNNYRKTKDGVATSIYNTQCANSIKRGHNKPTYTKDQFKVWLFNNKKFDRLYSDWVVSGYERNLKPSPDRKNNNKGYSFDNLKLGTCIENIRGKRVTFEKRDLSLLYPKIWEIKGNNDYYFTYGNLLINSRTNRKSKKIVKGGYSTGYNLNGKFITLKKLRSMLKKVNNQSNNNHFTCTRKDNSLL